jgi:hypothetical protein
MHELLERALAERGIDSNRTRIGQNVICRVGDPTNTNDLIRVGGNSRRICRIRRMCMSMCISARHSSLQNKHHLSNSPYTSSPYFTLRPSSTPRGCHHHNDDRTRH